MVRRRRLSVWKRSAEGTNESCLRRAEIHEGYEGPEYTLYIERPQGVLLLVLLARADEEKELRQNLEWVGQTLYLVNIDQLRRAF